MRFQRLCIALIAPACAFVFAGVLSDTRSGARPLAAQHEGRIAAPGYLKCPRNNTTSFTGRVLAYSRSRGRVFIRVRTDEETTEQFTLRYGRRDEASSIFRLRGEPFRSVDWRVIESRAGRLRPRMRATVWACYEDDIPKAELINWLPPEG